MRPPVDLRVYAVLDPTRCRDRSPAAMAAAAARGGATLIQLRDKDTRTCRAIDTAREVLAALAPFGCPLLVNDRVDVALAVGAQGVHLGQDDMGPEDARRLLGPGADHRGDRSPRRPKPTGWMRRSSTMPASARCSSTGSKADAEAADRHRRTGRADRPRPCRGARASLVAASPASTTPTRPP